MNLSKVKRKVINFNKKGQGEFVAYVLLIGLAVTLAVLVGRWSIEQAQKSSENVVRQSEIEDKCNEIAIGGFVDKSLCPGTQPNKVTVTNRGNLIIPSIRIRGEENKNCGFPDDQLVNLKPGKSLPPKTLNK